MSVPQHVRAHQITLQGMFEVITSCALVCAVIPRGDMLLLATVLAILTIWSSRVECLAVRLSTMVWLGGCAVACIGMLCLHDAAGRTYLETRRWDIEYLVFVGVVLSVLGAVAGAAGFAMLIVSLLSPLRARR